MAVISLVKGQKIDLRKSSGEVLTNFCVGVNWGAIEKIITQKIEHKGFFGFGKRTEEVRTKQTISVDLDLSCIMIDENKKLIDHIYSPLYKLDYLQKYGLPIGKLTSQDGALKHSGDDLEGDKEGDDGLDNEVITVDLNRIDPRVEQIFFFLNNVGKDDFSQIPYAKIRMYEGTPSYVKTVVASYNVSAEPNFRDKRSLIMGKLYKKSGSWKFHAIGDATEDVFIGQTIIRIINSYL